MGGDDAPTPIIAGAVRAVRNGFIEANDLILVGDEKKVRSILDSLASDLDFEIAHFPEVIQMDEDPIEAIRRKKISSIRGCVDLVREKKADAVVTAGHTGAAVAGATLRLKMLKGIRRAGLAVTFNGPNGPTTIIDVGANLTCKPINLFQYGLMGNYFAKDTLGIEIPRIALVNIGSEEKKGNRLVKETLDLFRRAGLNFVGNLEGQEIFRGKADIIVCEGFVGNVLLKVSEGLSEYLLKSIIERLEKPTSTDPRESIDIYNKAVSAVIETGSKIDYTEYGGALLLGVEGIVVIGHGRSDDKAIASALKLARRFAMAGVNKHIVAGIENSNRAEVVE